MKSLDTEVEAAANLREEAKPKVAVEENKQLQQTVKVDVVKVRTPEKPGEAATPGKRRRISGKRPATISPLSKTAAGSSPTKAAAVASPRQPTKLQCGVCGAVVRSGKSWAAHRARQHAGLARVAGEEQSFTREQEAAAVTAAFLACRRILCPRCRRRHYTEPSALLEHLRVCGVQEAVQEQEVPVEVPGVQGRSRRAAATRAKGRVAEFVKRITGRFDGESEGEAEPSEDGSDDYDIEKEEEEEEQTESEEDVESEQESEEYEEDSEESEERPRRGYRRRRSGEGGAGLRRAILEPCPQVLTTHHSSLSKPHPHPSPRWCTARQPSAAPPTGRRCCPTSPGGPRTGGGRWRRWGRWRSIHRGLWWGGREWRRRGG